ncbi:hypothetical protein GCM10007148_17610 [Parvularcula lutaonensis]|nr:Kiwa anti-phage protein KwaB-like domain-containing protein [Parvularcula lutaonensis]GGY49498.1 hypothetical protein GCM10007148_17610 [Parvularcula lutaonensis]
MRRTERWRERDHGKRRPWAQSGQAPADAEQQEQEFLSSITQEYAFDGGYSPERDEALFIGGLPDVKKFVDCVSGNATAIPAISQNEIASGRVKSLFMGDSSSSPTIIGVQSFRQNQILDKRRTLMLRKNTYNNLDTPSVVLNTKITAFISGKQLKFRSFHATRSIFDLTGHFRDATDDEIKTFANQTSVNIPDVKKFIEDADEVVRKKIYLIKKSGVLNNYKTKDLERAGKAAGVSIAMSGKAITFPDDKKQLKELLNFLDHGVYKSPISGDRFLANSKRKI